MARPASGVRVLYIVYWGAAEPLGQSLVLPAVQRLARLGAEITLVTFEKPDDLADRETMAAIHATLATHNIRWFGLRYHGWPKVLSTGLDMAHGWARGILAGLRWRPHVIHARTIVGGLVGQALASVLRVPWIYHNEGFYPDEQVDGGFWREGSKLHRLARTLERRMYEGADAIVALSQRAQRQIGQMAGVLHRSTPSIVVPSCVNLDLFGENRLSMAARGEGLRLVYTGSIGGRYRFDRVARFAAVAARELGNAHLRVLSRARPGPVEALAQQAELAPEAWSLDEVAHAAMPLELATRHAGLFFLTQGRSEHGCSPTKVGEYWASGLPVVTTPHISDIDEIIARERVGVIVRTQSEEAYSQGVRELHALLNDPDLPARCRRAAESHYALAPACTRQMALYQRLRATRQ
jgi:glycosyltransferase involved in cell wall biosynthesis